MFPQLDAATNIDVPLKDKITYFAAINLHHGANAEENETKTIKEKIKELVESPMTRYEGLLLFEAALQQNTPFYVEIWPRIIIANLISSDTTCQEIVYRILSSIIKSSKYASHLTTVQYHVPKILELLTEPNNTNCVAAMQCLALCIKACPAAVISRKDELEAFIMKQMDTNSSQISEAISDCFVNLFCCTSSIDRDLSSQQHRMLSNYKKLLYTMQEIINKLLNSPGVYYIGNDNKDSPLETFPLPDMPDVQISATMTLARIFNSLSSCTAKILCSEYHDKMQLEVPVIWILEFISRVFDIIQFSKNAEINEGELILIAYPTLLRGAFIILESLIQNFGLIEQVENVILLIRKSLEASYIASFTNSSNCQIRYMSWRVLNLWLNKNGSQVSVDAGNKKFLISELLKDTIPENVDEEPVTMIARHHPPSKMKKAECAFPEPGESSNFNKLRMNTTCEALKVLRSFLYTASPFLEEKFKEEITSSVLSSARKIQKYIHPQKKFPFPYMNDKCRKNLYELCLAFIVTSSFSIRVVMHSFSVLKVAQKDQNLKIREFCHIATPLYRLLLHPKKKFPEVLTNKKTVFEPPVEDNVYYGWEKVSAWNGNSDRNTHFPNQNALSCRQENLSPEAHNSINDSEIQNNYVSEKDYNSSEYETLTKGEIQCNGEDLSEVQVSSQSDSESDGTMENEASEEQIDPPYSLKPFITTVHSVAKDDTADHDISSEYDQMSVAEEELEDSKVSEEESKHSMRNNAIICRDQNGIASASDDEVPSSSRGENAEYSSEEDASYEEEEEESKELCDDQIQTVETLEESEPPLKKQRVNEEEEDQVVEEEVIEDGVIEDGIIEDGVVKDGIVEDGVKVEEAEKTENECNEESKKPEDESSRSKSPTFEQMCQDLVICESSKLVES